MNEKKAIQLCIVNHDPVGFEFLVEKFRREAYFHAVSFLKNHDDAVDACQECFSKAFQAMPKLEVLGSFYPWFYSILRNHCMNVIRKRQVINDYAIKQLENEVSQSELQTPSFLIEQCDEMANLRFILEKLSPDAKEIMTLKYIEEQSYEQIAKILHIPRGTVMSRLFNARKAFKKLYEASNR